MKQKITAPERYGLKVEVYEPRQTPEQAEVILETFELEPGEEREIEIRSATAGYRSTRIASDVLDRDKETDLESLNDPFANIPPAQERDLSAPAEAEIKAGKARQQETEKAEKKALSRERASEKKAGEKVVDKTTKSSKK